MSRYIDMIGKKCGMLLVVGKCETTAKSGDVRWDCVCDCGNSHIATGSHLRNGDTSSCGCIASRKTVGIRSKKRSEQVDEKSYVQKNSVLKESGCIEWTGALTGSGYGAGSIRKQYWLAHRLSYSVFVGEIPAGMFVCHKCDNPSCVNPDHLFLGTQQDNMTDKVVKVRHCHGETHGMAKLTEDQIIHVLSSSESSVELGRKYGVTTDHIACIRKGRVWKHIKQELDDAYPA